MTSKYLEPLHLSPLYGYDAQAKEDSWVLLNPDFQYHVGTIGSTEVISIPRGFVTDLASVPRIAHSIVSPYGRHTRAALVHDWLYRSQSEHVRFSRKEADAIFHEAMIVDGVPNVRAAVMYLCVRLFGRSSYKDPKPTSELVIHLQT